MNRVPLFFLLFIFFVNHNYAQTFENIATEMGLFTGYGFGSFGDGISFADFNDDGLMDIAVCNYPDKPFAIWKNNTNTNFNYWIKIALEGVESNRDGIGAWIEVTSGGLTQYRYTMCGEAYLGQNTLNHHIGLGADNVIDSLKVRWPSGNVDLIYNIGVNQKIKIKEGNGVVAPANWCADKLFIGAVSDNSIYNADKVLQSDCQIPSAFTVDFLAKSIVELLPGFEVSSGADFSVEIQGCH